jgi:hypothetical protein
MSSQYAKILHSTPGEEKEADTPPGNIMFCFIIVVVVIVY